MPPYQNLDLGADSRRSFSLQLLLSYVLDWLILVVVAVIGYILSRITPNKRPFSLVDPNISFPFTEHETVPDWLLVVLSALIPLAVILLVSLFFVPGATVSKGTPARLVWRRRLWELHVGWLGLLMSVGCGFFFISGIKNMCGKPRPDLLARCMPDVRNASQYAVGGFAGEAALGNDIGQLYSAAICQQPDRVKLNDGFRSYPSGHAASSAGGLIYLSLFLASKFAVTFPFVPADALSSAHPHHLLHAAFPSRRPLPLASAAADDSFDRDDASPTTSKTGGGGTAAAAASMAARTARHNANVLALRRQAAAPPIYLLAAVVAPFCLAIFISASRWFDFRHHGFDILFGFIIGIITAVFSFYYYHLPITSGAGWAWGPRSSDRAFWAGVGRLGYVGDNDAARLNDDLEPGRAHPHSYAHSHASPRLTAAGALNQRSATLGVGQSRHDDDDLELRDMDRQRGPTYTGGSR